MIDRFGKQVYVGWADHEVIWLNAALDLDIGDRAAALVDIASMSGRSVDAVRKKAAEILEERIMQAASRPKAQDLAPSAIAKPDKKRLMAGR